jgi:hypothetical protein
MMGKFSSQFLCNFLENLAVCQKLRSKSQSRVTCSLISLAIEMVASLACALYITSSYL